MNLSEACLNCNLKIKCLNGSECQRLREFGLSEGTELIKISENKKNLICKSCGVKIIVSKILGEQVILKDINKNDEA